MSQKILFISHEASQTGAPKVLLYFMQWLKKHHCDKYDIGILHLRGGSLEDKFNELAEYVYKLEPTTGNQFLKILNKLSKATIKPRDYRQKVINEIADQDFDLVYGNTALSLGIATDIKKQSHQKPKLIAHVHELNTILKLLLPNRTILKDVDRIIAVSELVKNNLIMNWDVEESKIDVVYEFSEVKGRNEKKIDSQKEFIVGASGFVHWRKGHDIFIQVARYIDFHFPDLKIKFQWIGKINNKEETIVNEDLRKLDLEDKVEFLGLRDDPIEYFKMFDVFLMTSREDPFPLVCIEVGMLGKPIVCFDQATGIQEVLSNGGGKIVPYLNIENMAKEIVNYYKNKKELKKDAVLSTRIFSEFAPNNQCPKIFKIINNTSH
jgi:glycosyltransferase involved in cell wall biosynthesis